ncbi:MAG: DUF1566 domain-containing protein [Candidatus Methylumidiphilus sp.]
MNTLKNCLPFGLLLVGMGFASAASASLETRPGGMVYDTDLNITWLADANLAASNTFGVSISNGSGPGTMTWTQAQSWVAAMNAANYLGYSDWRLPTTTDTGEPGCVVANSGAECGFNVNPDTSELAHLFFVELGNLSSVDSAGNSRGGFTGVNYGVVNTGPFTNLQNFYYWSGTEYVPDTRYAWFFINIEGHQLYGDKDLLFNGWAVRSGDVAAVPLPAAVWLFGSALTGLSVLSAKRRRG